MENHFVGPKAGGKGYVKYEAVVMEKFLEILQSTGIDSDELFDSCDVDNSGSISTEELKNFMLGIKKTMLLKELQML